MKKYFTFWRNQTIELSPSVVEKIILDYLNSKDGILLVIAYAVWGMALGMWVGVLVLWI